MLARRAVEKLTPTVFGLWLPCEVRMDLLWGSWGTGAPESKVPFKSAINQTTIKKGNISASRVFPRFSKSS